MQNLTEEGGSWWVCQITMCKQIDSTINSVETHNLDTGFLGQIGQNFMSSAGMDNYDHDKTGVGYGSLEKIPGVLEEKLKQMVLAVKMKKKK